MSWGDLGQSSPVGRRGGSISLAEALLSACHLLKVDMVIEEAEEISTVPRPVQNTD